MLAFLSSPLSLIVHVPARARSLTMSSAPGVEIGHEWALSSGGRTQRKTQPKATPAVVIKAATAVAIKEPAVEDVGSACIRLDGPTVEQCKDTFEQAEATGNQEGEWLFCEEPPIDPNVTCFLASDVDYLAEKAPEGQPWLCTTSSALHDPMPDITHEAGKSEASEDSY